jgi:hypothetical protein
MSKLTAQVRVLLQGANLGGIVLHQRRYIERDSLPVDPEVSAATGLRDPRLEEVDRGVRWEDAGDLDRPRNGVSHQTYFCFFFR